VLRKLALTVLLGFSLVWTGCGGDTSSGAKPAPSGANPGASPTPLPTTSANFSSCSGMSRGQLGSLNGFRPLATNSAWNTDISQSPVDPNSAALINFIGPATPLHAAFGAGLLEGSSLGIPYVVVDGTQPGVNITAQFSDQSDPGPMPIPADAPIEGYPNPGNGDRHVLVLDNANCFLYELFSSYPSGNSSWSTGSAAVWDLLSNEQRPFTWTSADAAGLPIFPGLVRYDEVASGQIQHAIRFTLPDSRAAFVPPASHWTQTTTDPNAPLMGMRMRLKATFDVSGYSATNQVILNAMKKYGIIMGDNGSPMYFSGTPDSQWNNGDLNNLGNVTAGNFEVVLMNPIYTSANIPQGPPPAINSFTASATAVSAGGQVTLSWSVANASYLIISPEVSAVRGSSITVTPAATTTYTLYAANQYGRNSATVTVTVQ
jgi:hypothetical protein